MKRHQRELYLAQLVVLVPIFHYWLDGLDYSLEGLTIFKFFPLLGLVAFSMMWFHLMVAYLRRKLPDAYDYTSFFRRTSNLVLVLIILHPALLIYKSSAIGSRFLDYAGPDGQVYIAFGSLALLTFLIYEVVERMRERPVIKNNWQFVVAMNRIGFILIYVHGLSLGQHLQAGWLRGLWLFFGATSLLYFISAYKSEIKRDSAK